jgi:hypothetical protein
MTAALKHSRDRDESSPYVGATSRYGAMQDPASQPVNWILLVAVGGCLAFWSAAVFSILAAV